MAGLFKKAVISDYISVNFVERIFDNPALYSGLENLLGVYGYTLQIYCDFSGYSDMAIGLALWLGFRFPQNFNSPYKSDSITDFWRRWRALHGVGQAFYKFYSKLRGYPKKYHPTGLKRFVAIFITFHFVAFCWIFFRNATLENSFVMLEQMFTNFNAALLPQLLQGYGPVFALMALGYIMHFLPDSWSQKCERGVIRLPLFLQAVLFILVIYIVIQVKSSDIQPFIYFQF